MKKLKMFMGVMLFNCALLNAGTVGAVASFFPDPPPIQISEPVITAMIGNLRLTDVSYTGNIGQPFSFTAVLDFTAIHDYWDSIGPVTFALDFGDATFETFSAPQVTGGVGQNFLQASSTFSHAYSTQGIFTLTPYLLHLESTLCTNSICTALPPLNTADLAGLTPSYVSYATVAAVPEANTWVMFFVGLVGLFSLAKFRESRWIVLDS